MNKSLTTAVFALGLTAVAWVGWGFVGTSPLALALTLVIAAVYLLGSLELAQFRRATTTLAAALHSTQEPVAEIAPWLERLHPALRHPVRQRIEGERVALPGPTLAPYLAGLLVMLGMLGTFLGMVMTFKGAVFALETSSSLEAIRGALAEPIKGLGLSFGTSVAGVAASAMLGLMTAMARRERLAAVRLLDARIPAAFRPLSASHRRQEALDALQAQAHALPRIAEQLQGIAEGLDRRHRELAEQLRAQQADFHAEASRAYQQLAHAVGASLNESLGASARVAGETLRPVVEHAMAELARESERSHQRLADATAAQMKALAAQWEGSAERVSETWSRALDEQSGTQARLVSGLEGALTSATALFEQRSVALQGALQDTVAQSQAAQSAADQERLAAWRASMEGMAQTLAARWEAAGDAAALQQQGVRDALEATAQGLRTALYASTEALEQRSQALLAALEGALAQSHALQAAADQARLSAWNESVAAFTASLTAQWQRATVETLERQQGVFAGLEKSVASLTERVGEQSARMVEGSARWVAQSDALMQARTQAEAQWLQAQGERMDALSAVWRTELAALRDAEAERGRQAVDRLETLQSAVAQHLAALGATLEAPLTRLLQTASEVPQAAAQVIAQLRQEMTHLSERDNLAMAERQAMAQQLGSLLQSVGDAAAQQRGAMESLTVTASTVLQQAVEHFADALQTQAGQASESAAHVAASAVELSSLGEAFSHGVGLFSESNQKLMESLQRIEGAIGQSLSRSDEQLAYYVAQAREVIDLSIASQRGIVDDLRQLRVRGPAVHEVAG